MVYRSALRSNNCQAPILHITDNICEIFRLCAFLPGFFHKGLTFSPPTLPSQIGVSLSILYIWLHQSPYIFDWIQISGVRRPDHRYYPMFTKVLLHDNCSVNGRVVLHKLHNNTHSFKAWHQKSNILWKNTLTITFPSYFLPASLPEHKRDCLGVGKASPKHPRIICRIATDDACTLVLFVLM